MDEPVENGFEYIKQRKSELDGLMLGRNELAKWIKLNSTIPAGIKESDIGRIEMPPMTKLNRECKNCFSKEICVTASVSLEADKPPKAPAGDFNAYREISERLTP